MEERDISRYFASDINVYVLHETIQKRSLDQYHVTSHTNSIK